MEKPPQSLPARFSRILLRVFIMQAACLFWTDGLGAQVPNAVVERFVTIGDRTTRVTLFNNRIAVVTVQEKAEQILFHQLCLDEDEYLAYQTAISSSYEARADEPRRKPMKTRYSQAVITMVVKEGEVITLHYSPLAGLDLSTARLVAALDDLELKVIQAGPFAEQVRTWTPKKGDVVERYDGCRAKVEEVREDGSLLLNHARSPVLEEVPQEQRSEIILRVVSEVR
jgi:hypothetical protein